MKKFVPFCVLIMVISLVAIGAAIATEKGPAEMTLESTVDPASKPKPAIFPHEEHQSRLSCADCHHGKDDAGKRIDYTEGQAIEKCESCHNKAAGMPKKVETFKAAAHALCKDCHKAASKDLAKCGTCHSKK